MEDELPSFGPLKDRLHELYGIEFPDSLFFLHEFLQTYPQGEKADALGSLGIHPTGLLQVLGRIVEGQDTSTIKPIILHYRYYRDLPEFFTCLHGDTDGLHWGLLWDEPVLGFRGAASYYNNDGDHIRVHRGLFDALLRRVNERLESAEEMIRDDPENEQEYRKRATAIDRMKGRLLEFVNRHGVRFNDLRPSGIESDTGLDLVIGEKYLGRAVDETPRPSKHWQALSPERVKELLSECRRGRVVPAMQAGRSLWYWAGREYSSDAYKLLRAGYARLERPELIKILDVHYENRDMKSVDLLAR
jgi:hypothetical protein